MSLKLWLLQYITQVLVLPQWVLLFFFSSSNSDSTFTGCLRVLTECSPRKSDTIKKMCTKEHINSQSSHLHCSLFPILGIVLLLAGLPGLSQGIFPFIFQTLSLLLGNISRVGHDKCRLQLWKIKQLSSNSSQSRGRDTYSIPLCFLYEVCLLKQFPLCFLCVETEQEFCHIKQLFKWQRFLCNK